MPQSDSPALSKVTGICHPLCANIVLVLMAKEAHIYLGIELLWGDFQLFGAVHSLGCKGFIDFKDINIIDGKTRVAQGCGDGESWANAHDRRRNTDHGKGAKDGEDLKHALYHYEYEDQSYGNLKRYKRTGRPRATALERFMRSTAAAPSDIWEALPGVVLPPFLNTAGSLASFSAVVPARIPSSSETCRFTIKVR